jgi:hypothetical protein
LPLQIYTPQGLTLALMKVVGRAVFFAAVATTIVSFQIIIVSWSTSSAAACTVS